MFKVYLEPYFAYSSLFYASFIYYFSYTIISVMQFEHCFLNSGLTWALFLKQWIDNIFIYIKIKVHFGAYREILKTFLIYYLHYLHLSSSINFYCVTVLLMKEVIFFYYPVFKINTYKPTGLGFESFVLPLTFSNFAKFKIIHQNWYLSVSSNT